MQGHDQNIGEVLLFGWQPLYLPKIWQNSPVFGLLPTGVGFSKIFNIPTLLIC
jgi:superfamily II DNA helicase RecQ